MSSEATDTNSEVESFVVLAPSEGITAGDPLGLLVFARDSQNNPVDTFTGTVNFSASSGTVTPASSGPFTSGYWRGSINITEDSYENAHYHEIFVYVNDGKGHAGSCGPIPVYPRISSPAPSPSPSPTNSVSPSPLLSPSPNQGAEPLSTNFIIIASALLAFVIGASLLIYFKKRKH